MSYMLPISHVRRRRRGVQLRGGLGRTEGLNWKFWVGLSAGAVAATLLYFEPDVKAARGRASTRIEKAIRYVSPK